jgi:hypothetical protein
MIYKVIGLSDSDAILFGHPKHRSKSTSLIRMKITVKKLGDSNKCLTLDIESADRIEDVKEMIACREGVAPSQQRLIFCGKQLMDGNTLYDYSITTNATIYLQVRPVELDECVTNCYVENAEVPVANIAVERFKTIPPCCHSTHLINAAY